MACQKVHKQGKIKVMVSIQSFIHPYIFSQRSKDVGMELCILTITFIFPRLCTFWHAIPRLEFIVCWPLNYHIALAPLLMSSDSALFTSCFAYVLKFVSILKGRFSEGERKWMDSQSNLEEDRRLRKLPLWNFGVLQFEFLKLSNQFQHEAKALGLQLKIMVTSQCPSNDTDNATRCLTRDCSNVSNVKGTCLYKMIVIGSLQDSFLKLIILARFWRTRDGLAEPTAASNYIFESVQQPLQAYRLERPREWLHEQRQTDSRIAKVAPGVAKSLPMIVSNALLTMQYAESATRKDTFRQYASPQWRLAECWARMNRTWMMFSWEQWRS